MFRTDPTSFLKKLFFISCLMSCRGNTVFLRGGHCRHYLHPISSPLRAFVAAPEREYYSSPAPYLLLLANCLLFCSPGSSSQVFCSRGEREREDSFPTCGETNNNRKSRLSRFQYVSGWEKTSIRVSEATLPWLVVV